jgi:hypothetical protein
VTRKLTVFVFAIAIGTGISACAPVGTYIRPSEAVLATEGTTIQFNSGTAIRSGQSFTPATYLPARIFENREKLLQPQTYRAWLQMGAEPVRVMVPGRAEPLYGIIAFHELSEGHTGPATRSYQVEVPSQYVEAATGGRVSVVYEVGTFNKRDGDIAWVLWLSDRPIS